MEIDARTIPSPATLDTDLCIIGSGPAGLAVAGEVLSGELDVVILESGGVYAEPWTRALNQGHTIGDSYAGLGATRHRQLGGAVQVWNTPIAGGIGAKYVPLDPWDLAAGAQGAWPFDYSELIPWYRRAQVACGLGPFEYAGLYWSTTDRPGFEFADGLLTTRVYQAGPARRFTEGYLGELRKSPKVRLVHHATAIALNQASSGRRIEAVRAVAPDGRALEVRARAVVLAGGAVENARLLLLSSREDRSGWLGRGFMEHPRDYGLTLVPQSPEFAAEAGFYDLHPASDGTIIGGRLALSSRAVLGERFPNASVSLFPRWHAPRQSAAARLVARWFGNPRALHGGYGWSFRLADGRPPDYFQLVVNLEQRPNPENRIVLARDRDPLGVARVELHWRWRDEEQRELERLRTRIAHSLEQAGLGRVTIQAGSRPDPNAQHHAGTTRMHRDPGQGVVDPEGRVHGIENLYVAGGSVFPSAGFANPTLTIVALALRLGDQLRRAG